MKILRSSNYLEIIKWTMTFLPDNEGEAPLLEPYMRVLYPESLCASCKGGVGL